jgi:hypothetical protein
LKSGGLDALREDIARYKLLLEEAQANEKLPVPDRHSRGNNVEIITAVIAELER